MHILGLANGTAGGNSEILLKAALTAAQKVDPSITTSWIHVPSVVIPTKSEARDLKDPLNANKESTGSTGDEASIDDRAYIMDAILEADALIFATPVYSHLPAGTLKVMFDRIGSMSTSAAFVHRVVEAEKMGKNTYDGMKIDKRVLRPKVAAFIVVAGSGFSDQFTLALPPLHQFVFPFHAKVVDQHIFKGFGLPGTVLLDKSVVERAQTLGRNIASQMGKSFDDAQYLGEQEPNACHYCHLSKIEFNEETPNGISCLTCSARGTMQVGNEGKIRPVWEVPSTTSFHTLAGLLKHGEESLSAPLEEIAKIDTIKDQSEYWANFRIPKAVLASNC